MEIESPRRSYGNSSSPEFEFWMVSNHPELEPNLLTADELFVDGVLLPLQLLSIVDPKPNSDPEPVLESKSESETKQEEEQESEVDDAPPPAPAPPPAHPEASICSSTPSPTSSKRWKDIFKVGEKKKESAEEKEKKKEKKPSNGTTELNINIWPFSRSRSAGTAGARPKPPAMRKSSSAPCSRSNSRGENSGAGGRRWAASPGRPGIGVHVGRASPVWQVKRAGKGPESGPGRAGPREKGRKGVNGGVRGLNLNVNSCIGYRNQGRCRGEESDNGGNNGGLFRFRALFSKKVY